MSESDIARVRAEGMFQTFLAQARKELDDKNRSDEYRLNFWAEIATQTRLWREAR